MTTREYKRFAELHEFFPTPWIPEIGD